MKKVEIIARLKEVANTKLEKRVLNIILQNTENYTGTFEEKLNGVFNDFNHGCQTGVVSELIFYKDTNRFFDTYRKDIIELVNDCIVAGFETKEGFNENTCEYYSYIEILGVEYKLNNNETLKNYFDMYQKNNLAWLGFEEVCYKFNNEFEEIINN